MDDDEALPLLDAALAGNDRALEALVRGVQQPVHRLALRMLGHLADAQDATQEILIRIVTSLASFQRRSSFSTWVYSIAANHLRDAAVRRQSRAMASLDAMAAQLDAGLAATARLEPACDSDDPSLRLQARELGLRCTQGMLMGLDADHRLALVLSDIFGLETAHGAQVLAISPAAYRQRLSRARRRLEDFMRGRCGLVDESAACTCARQVQATRALTGQPVPIRWAAGAAPDRDRAALEDGYRELALMQRIAATLRQTPAWQVPAEVTQRLHEVIAASAVLGGRTSRCA
jgi:RNA polymerase sigma factor (sigma-70 family)